MKGFWPVVRDIRKTLRGITLFTTLLNTTIVFLAIYCFLSVFNLYPLTGGGIGGIIYFIVKLNRGFKQVKLFNVERMYPDLYERLRTAADCPDEDNLIVHRLHREVISKLRKVKASSFLHTGAVSLKVLLICALFFLTIFVTSLNLHFLDVNQAVSGIDINFDFQEYVWGEGTGGANGTEATQEQYQDDNASQEGGNASFDDIYGEMSIAEIEEREQEMELTLEQGTDDFKNIKDIEEKDFSEFPAEEVSPQAAEYDQYVVPKEQQELVKDYFERINR